METTTDEEWFARIIQALTNIHARLDAPMTYHELAELSASSPYYFHRIFREMVGETASACIRRLRVERAAMQLRITTRNIIDIALDAGFESPEAFSRAFRTYFWLTPSDFRRRTHACCWLGSPARIHYQGLSGSEDWTLLHQESEEMMTQVIELTAMRALGLRNVGSYATLPESWQKFHQLLGQNHLYPAHARWMIAFHDAASERPEHERRADVCCTVPADFELPSDLGELHLFEIPAQRYGITIHWGDCDGIADTWERWLQEWLPRNGYRQVKNGIALEWYQNDCSTIPSALAVTFLATPIETL